MTETFIEIDTERPLRADARRNRERILESAREVFAETGVEAQMDDVAAAPASASGTVYRHFPTKEALMAELVRQKFRLFAARRARGARARRRAVRRVRRHAAPQRGDVRASDAAMQHALTGVGEHIWARRKPSRTSCRRVTDELIARAQRAGHHAPRRAGDRHRDADVRRVLHDGPQRPGFDWHRHLELVIDMLRAR